MEAITMGPIEKLVLILSGISGSGKSTYGKRELAKFHAKGKSGIICSADDYFMENGVYNFDPSKLPQAHGQCLRKFVTHAVLEKVDILIVDNTNTTVAEIAPYAALALAYGYEMEIVTIRCNLETATKRNTHGVPVRSLQSMQTRLDSRELPPWWTECILNGELPFANDGGSNG